jgi:hypothetical protein
MRFWDKVREEVHPASTTRRTEAWTILARMPISFMR